MCGILAYTKNALTESEINELRANIQRRGPDHWCVIERGPFYIESTILALRDPLTPQPLSSPTEGLAYNGELYDLPGNDSQWLWEHRSQLMTRSLEGEYAFAWYDGSKLMFGRDSIGRRSLVYRHNDQELVVSSVSTGEPGWIECDAGVLYSFENGTLMQTSFKEEFSVSRDTSCGDMQEASRALTFALSESAASRTALPSFKAPSISVLFSGGLDCTFLAKILDKVARPDLQIELVNVAFENRRTNKQPAEAPDRILAQKTHAEEFSSSDRVSLSLVDVSYEQAIAASDDVRQLMFPSTTVMDFSIALAFYFAAKHASSQVLFSGLGADELFGGYGRHERAADLASELELDFGRLGHRNLGRDDRVMAAHAREVRYPYLDSRVIKLAKSLPLDCKRNKCILRKAAGMYGIGDAAVEKKRAIQFGARTAKMDPGSGQHRGTDAIVEAVPGL